MKNLYMIRLGAIYFSFVGWFLLSATQALALNDSDTLKIVNWNLEWFGNGSSHNATTQKNQTAILMNLIKADAYALCEIVNVDTFASMVQSLDGDYEYVVSTFGSFADDANDVDYPSAQKLAFVYRKSVFKNVSGRALMVGNPDAYYNFSSGRYPYLVQADVAGRDGIWRTVKFVILHAKANSDYSSCQRRTFGSIILKDSLDNRFANDRLVILGDYNDDLDVSICSNGTPSNYSNFVKDSTDANSYRSLTLTISMAGEFSLYGYSSLIDHVMVSNEMAPYYVPGSARSLRQQVEAWMPSYHNDVSDHHPIVTQYLMGNLPSSVNNIGSPIAVSVYPNPTSSKLFIQAESKLLKQYWLVNSGGQSVKAGICEPLKTELNIAGLPAGVYALHVTATSGNTGTYRVVVLP